MHAAWSIVRMLNIDTGGHLMRINLAKLSLSILCLTTATALFANDEIKKITLDMHDEEFTNYAEIDLKEKIKDIEPAIDFYKYRLESVNLLAKSKRGKSLISLTTKDFSSVKQRVEGTPDHYIQKNPKTFNEVSLSNGSKTSYGNWKLKMRGHIQLRVITINLQEITDRESIRESLQCESQLSEVNKCFARGEILEADIARRLTSRFCVKDLNWGVTKDHVWVSQGCKAVFNLSIKE